MLRSSSASCKLRSCGGRSPRSRRAASRCSFENELLGAGGGLRFLCDTGAEVARGLNLPVSRRIIERPGFERLRCCSLGFDEYVVDR